MIWTEYLCHKFYRRLHWYHNYCLVMQRFLKVTLAFQPVNYYHNYFLVMQRFLKVTFTYQPVNYLEFKLWIMTKSKSKTKMMLMEPINSSKSIILDIESCYWYCIRRSCSHTFELLDFLNGETRTCFYCVGDTVTPKAPHGGGWGAEKSFIFKCSKTPEKHFKNLFLCFFIESWTRLDLFQKHHFVINI